MKTSLAFLPGILTLAVACGSVAQPATPITGADGAWSNAATWGGKLSNGNSSVTIPAGKTITVDSSITVRSVTVGGTFQLGSASQPFTKRATVTLTGTDTTQDIMGIGTKCLCAMGGGQLQIYGEDRLSWTKLSASAAAGSRQITLLEAGGWRSGEKIVVASSSFEPEEAEVRGIAGVSSDGKTLTLDAPLRCAHFGLPQSFDGKSLDERAEVGLLSRNIVIQGDEASSALKFGGHVMVMNSGSVAKIRGVEFKRMGQFNRLGRYPLHFHQMRDAMGSFVVSSSLSGLQAQTSSGYFADASELSFKFFGGDQLRFERL